MAPNTTEARTANKVMTIKCLMTSSLRLYQRRQACSGNSLSLLLAEKCFHTRRLLLRLVLDRRRSLSREAMRRCRALRFRGSRSLVEPEGVVTIPGPLRDQTYVRPFEGQGKSRAKRNRPSIL